MKTDKITVIIPCWNYGMFLRECLDSVLAQTVKPGHIIFADDCSTDNSLDIANEYFTRAGEGEFGDIRFTIQHNVERLGTIGNENRAAGSVGSPWLFFLDADDKIEPTYIEKALEVIGSHNENLMVVYSDMLKFGNWEGVWVCAEWNREQLRVGNFINGHSLLRKDLFDRIGGLKDNGHFEDHWMWVEMMDLDPALYGVRIPEPLVLYRRHDYGHRTDHSDIGKRSNLS